MKRFVHRFLIVCSQVIPGCLFGLVMLLFYASRSDLVRQEIKKSVQSIFKTEFNCDWDGDVDSIDLLSLDIQFSNVSMLPCDRNDGWSLYTDKFHASASLLDFIIYRKFLCHGYFEQVIVYEHQDSGRSQFLQVLTKMFMGSLPGNMSFNYLTVKQGQFVATDLAGDVQGSYTYNAQMSCEGDGIHTKLYILDGNCLYKNIVVFEKMFGNCSSIIPYKNDLKEFYARVDVRLTLPALADKGACFLLGDLYAGRGAFVLSNDDQSFIVEPLKIRLKKNSIPLTCSISMESEVVQRLIAQQIITPDVTGNLTITLLGNALDLGADLQAVVQVQNLMYKHTQLIDRAIMTCIKNHDRDEYVTKCMLDHKLYLQGTLEKTEQGLQGTMMNLEELPLWWNRYWQIPVKQGIIHTAIDLCKYQVIGDYQFQLQSAKLDAQTDVQGTFELSLNKIACDGSFLDKKYECSIELQPIPHLVLFRYFSPDEEIINFHEHQDPLQGTVGFVGFNFLKNILADQYKLSFSQPGKFMMSGNVGQGIYRAQVTTQDAHIRIPSLYNVIQSFTAETQIDFIGRSVTLDNMITNLYEGTVRCDHAIATFDNQAQPYFLHIPLFLDSVLMCWSKGIFGIVSGRLFLSQKPQESPILQGNLILDKAQLKGNILSKEFQEQLIGAVGSSQGIDADCQLDVCVETKEPIEVQTSFLQATVHLDLHATNTIKQPELEGTIDIASGELKFPYKSLFITHGQILIMPKRSTDPTIEFIAKGKIKRYDITMRATGTMIDQQIHFESSPYLTEEQIISLLLVGSQDSSLSVVMPTMLMQKLQEIVFGPAISKSKLDVMFNRLLQSFKNVRIFPQFTNQTGRGGVRGVVEVDATDRLHGRIDSNLMQLEDTIFEADYLLTDDVTIRAIKDGPSTYGGEVEMRWKFS